jgi:hypothetical protein
MVDRMTPLNAFWGGRAPPHATYRGGEHQSGLPQRPPPYAFRDGVLPLKNLQFRLIIWTNNVIF